MRGAVLGKGKAPARCHVSRVMHHPQAPSKGGKQLPCVLRPGHAGAHRFPERCPQCLGHGCEACHGAGAVVTIGGG